MILIIGPNEKKAIAAAIDYARQHVIPWSIIKDAIIDTPTDTLALADRKPGFERPASEHIMLGGFRAAISFEEQPAGICRHLSVSPIPKQAEVFAMIADEFGFNRFDRVWREEYDPGCWAVNVLEVTEPRKE